MKDIYKSYVNNERKTIIILAGGTLGHINPALEISKLFYNDGYYVVFITTNNRLVNSYFEGNNHLKYNYYSKIYFMSSPGFSKKIIKNVKSFFTLVKTKKEIDNIYKTFNPCLIIGFGGSISTIGLITRKYKKALHEQNAIVGNGNKFISKMYKDVYKYSSYPIKGFINVNNPLITCAYENNISMTKDSILIFGGSNGSDKINDFILDNFDILNFKDKVYLFTGKKYYDKNRKKIEVYVEKYKEMLIIIDSSKNMNKYYNKAKVVVARAGAGTISEIIGYKIPSIIIPSPNVMNNHQYYNAKYYSEKNMTIMIEEKDLMVDSFIKKYNELLSNKDLMINNMESINNNSKYIFYDHLLNIIKED